MAEGPPPGQWRASRHVDPEWRLEDFVHEYFSTSQRTYRRPREAGKSSKGRPPCQLNHVRGIDSSLNIHQCPLCISTQQWTKSFNQFPKCIIVSVLSTLQKALLVLIRLAHDNPFLSRNRRQKAPRAVHIGWDRKSHCQSGSPWILRNSSQVRFVSFLIGGAKSAKSSEAESETSADKDCCEVRRPVRG